MAHIQHRGLTIITGSARLPGDLHVTSPRAPGEPSGGPTTGVNLSPVASADPLPGASWTMRILDWMPTPLNRLLGHWAVANRKKTGDYLRVLEEALRQHIPSAVGKRRVSVLVVLPKGQRATDPDSLSKSLLDALTRAKLLRNDSHLWCDPEPARFARGDRLCTYVTLENILG